MVEVYATVTDADGRPAAGLGEGDFIVLENGQPQDIAVFAAGDIPVTVVLGVDRSWSMAGEPLRLAKEASRLLLSRLGPDDRSMVVAIDRGAEVVAPASGDHARQMAAVDAFVAQNTTALHDAVITTLDRLHGERGRVAFIVLSDGVDRLSDAPAFRVIERARRGQVLVYPVTLGREQPSLAGGLAGATGGRAFLLPDAGGLEQTFAAIERELRDQYLIGYVAPDGDGAGQWRSIRVEVRSRPGLVVRTREGYTAP